MLLKTSFHDLSRIGCTSSLNRSILQTRNSKENSATKDQDRVAESRFLVGSASKPSI